MNGPRAVLAARPTAEPAWNQLERRTALVAAASRGRLAVRWWCQDAPKSVAKRLETDSEVTEISVTLKTSLSAFVALSTIFGPLTGATQVLHHIAAANIVVVQNDTNNTTASVTVSTSLSINDFRIRAGSNRGDCNVQIGSASTDD